MIKTVAIVSLSYGIMGEESAKHKVEIGIKRLQDYGLEVRYKIESIRKKT